MAEKIRSILLKEYKANKVDITQKIDENSFSGSLNTSDRWSFSSNSTLFLFMAIVLCGGILVGFQKKFPFKYQDVYSKLTSKQNPNKIQSISIEQYSQQQNDQQHKDLNVGTSQKAKKNSAETFLLSLFDNLGTPSFMFEKNIQKLKDDYISSIEQLREFDDGDWKRYGFKNSHIIMIKNKLQNDGDENDKSGHRDDSNDDDLTFDDDDDGWSNDKQSKTNNKQTDTSDFDDDFDD